MKLRAYKILQIKNGAWKLTKKPEYEFYMFKLYAHYDIFYDMK